MIRCNLYILLAERNLKITKVSNDTGISRTTLTALANDKSKGIQFDTINTLCNYLKIGPEQLISYVPVDIEIDRVELVDTNLNIDLKITKNLRVFYCGLTGNCYATFTDGKLSDLTISIDLFDEKLNNNDDLINKNLIITNAFNMLSIPFINDIEEKILEKIISYLDTDLCSSFSKCFLWDKKLMRRYFPD